MDIWNILGISPDEADERTIRRAYAKNLKTTRPDESPEAFQILRKAYECALAISKVRSKKESVQPDNIIQFAENAHKGESDIVIESEGVNEGVKNNECVNEGVNINEGASKGVNESESESENESVVVNGAGGGAAGPAADSRSDPVWKFCERFHALANDFTRYADREPWESLLSYSDGMNLWDREQLFVALPYLLNGIECLPSFFCAGLEQRFRWSDQIGRIDSRHPDDILVAIAVHFEYAMFVRPEEIAAHGGTFDEVKQLSNICMQLMNLQYGDALVALENMTDEGRNDRPATRKLYLYILYLAQRWTELIPAIKNDRATQENAAALYEALFLARAYLMMGETTRAGAIYEDILAQHPEQPDALRGAAACLAGGMRGAAATYEGDANPRGSGAAASLEADTEKALAYCNQLMQNIPDEIMARLIARKLSITTQKSARRRARKNSLRIPGKPFRAKILKISMAILGCILIFAGIIYCIALISI